MKVMTVTAAVWVAIGGLSFANAANAAVTHFNLHIPREPLDAALRDLAHQTGVQVGHFSDQAKSGLLVGPVQGSLSPADALGILLRSTGLSYRALSDRAYIVATPSALASARESAQGSAGGAGNGVGATNLSSTDSSVPAGKEGKSGSSDRFRLAQAASGQAAGTPTVESPQRQTQSLEAPLQEVIVTAQRREESIEKVPMSLTAIPQRTLDELNIQTVRDLADVVPGLFLNPVYGNGVQDQQNVTIRGVYSGNNAPVTQFYIDETPIAIRQLNGAGNSYSPEPQMFDLDRVEVLRGPQGTLFGSSAMGGAIRFLTPQPNLYSESGFAKADISYTDQGGLNYEVGAAFGAPVIQRELGFRVSAWYQSEDGFINQADPYTGGIIKKNINSSNSLVVRPAFTWSPSDSFSVTPALFVQHLHSDSPAEYWVTQLAQTDGRAWGGARQPLTDDLSVASVAVKANLGSVVFQSDSSYLDRKERAIDDFTHIIEFLLTDGSPGFPSGVDSIPGLSSFHSLIQDYSSTHAWMQEFRISSSDSSSRVTWVAGAFYRYATTGLKQLVSPDLSPITEAAYGLNSDTLFGYPNYDYFGQTLNAFQDYQTTDVSEAVFADLTAQLTPRLKLAAGVRYEHSIVDHQREAQAGPLDGSLYVVNILADQVDNPVTPRASLTYQVSDSDMVYASASKGYRPGGGNAYTVIGNPLCAPSLHTLGLSTVPRSFNSDSLWSYEIGTKDVMFERRLAISGSIYYINWTNIQTGLQLPSCAEGFTINFGKAISQGADLQLDAAPTDHLKVHLLASYSNAYYPNTEYGPSSPGSPPRILTLAGDKLYGFRPWTAEVNAEYLIDSSAIWAGSTAYIRPEFRWQEVAPPPNPDNPGFDPTIGPRGRDGEYGLLNIRAGLKLSGGWDLSLYVDNLTNANPYLAYGHTVPGDPLFTATALTPRTLGLTAWLRY